jgi:hypothetical protein
MKSKEVKLIDVKKFMSKVIHKSVINLILICVISLMFLISIIFLELDVNDKNKAIEYLQIQVIRYKNVVKERQKSIDKSNDELGYYQFKQFYTNLMDGEVETMLNCVWKNSKINKLNPYHVLLIIAVESNFNTNAISPTGDYGLMQVHYNYWKTKYKLSSPEKLFDPELNIKIGCEIFRGCLNDVKGDFAKALLIYNSGNKKYTNTEYLQNVFRSKFYDFKKINYSY